MKKEYFEDCHSLAEMNQKYRRYIFLYQEKKINTITIKAIKEEYEYFKGSFSKVVRSVVKQIYCRNCGDRLKGQEFVCSSCGTKVGLGVSYCGNCRQITVDGLEFCNGCGAKLTNIMTPNMKKEKKQSLQKKAKNLEIVLKLSRYAMFICVAVCVGVVLFFLLRPRPSYIPEPYEVKEFTGGMVFIGERSASVADEVSKYWLQGRQAIANFITSIVVLVSLFFTRIRLRKIHKYTLLQIKDIENAR